MIGNRILYSFPKAQLNKKTAKENIGPGKYDPNSQKIKCKNPQWSFPKNQKNNNNMSNNPAPGQYDFSVKKTQKLGKINNSKRSDLYNKTNEIGPGNYELKSLFDDNVNKKKGPSISYKYKKKDNILNNPCPFKYIKKSIFDINQEKSKGYSIPKSSPRKNFIKYQLENPGPGQYNNINKKSKKGGKFGRLKRNETKKNYNPGPGHYEDGINKKNNSKKYSIRKKFRNKDLSRNKVPGPGLYNSNFDIIKDNNPKWSFSKQGRTQSAQVSKNYNLGPGSYELNNKKIKKGGFIGKNSRNSLKDDSNEPGPGHYKFNPSTLKANVNFGNSFKSKFFKANKKVKNNVGPGTYQSKLTLTKKRPISCKFGKSKSNFRSNNDNPGSGTYNIKSAFSKTKLKGFHFGKEKNKTKKNENPGPGSYQINKTLLKTKNNFTFKQKYQKGNKNAVVGPGTYDPSCNLTKMKKSKAIIFGKQKRSTRDKNDLPSPTSYYKNNKIPFSIQSNLNKGNNIKIGKQSRDYKEKKGNLNPGPGFYELESIFNKNRKKNKGKTFSQKFKSYMRNNSPGPGTYDDQEKQSAIKKTMVSNFKNTAQVKFGSEKRFNNNKSDNNHTIGPGSYNIDYKMNKKNPDFTKNNRFKKKMNEIPGPGHYDLISPLNYIPSYCKDQVHMKQTV